VHKRSSSLTWNRTLFTTLALAGMVLFMTGCTSGALSIDADVTLAVNENWRVQISLVYNQIEYQIIGGQIEQALETAMNTFQKQGVQFNYKKRSLHNDNIEYTITASGKGYQLLNQTFFDGTATILVDQNVSPPVITFQYVPFGTYFGAALSRTFTLHGGKIISTNGTRVGNSAVRWTKPTTTMEASLTASNQLSLLTIIIGLGGVALLIIIVMIIRNRKRKTCPYCSARIPRGSEFCPICGQQFHSMGQSDGSNWDSGH
jgi:hypothetical protein